MSLLVCSTHTAHLFGNTLHHIQTVAVLSLAQTGGVQYLQYLWVQNHRGVKRTDQKYHIRNFTMICHNTSHRKKKSYRGHWNSGVAEQLLKVTQRQIAETSEQQGSAEEALASEDSMVGVSQDIPGSSEPSVWHAPTKLTDSFYFDDAWELVKCTSQKKRRESNRRFLKLVMLPTQWEHDWAIWDKKKQGALLCMQTLHVTNA